MFEVLWWVRIVLFVVVVGLCIKAGRRSYPGTANRGATREQLPSIPYLEPAQREGPHQTTRVDRRDDVDILWSCGVASKADPDVPLTALVGAHETPDAKAGLHGVVGRADAPQVTVSRLASIVMRPKTSSDRLGLTLGLQRQHESGDSEFDERVYVESYASPELIKALIASGEVRRGVLRMLDHGFRSVEFYTPNAQLEATIFNPLPDTYGALESVGDTLVSIARGLPRIALGGASEDVIEKPVANPLIKPTAGHRTLGTWEDVLPFRVLMAVLLINIGAMLFSNSLQVQPLSSRIHELGLFGGYGFLTAWMLVVILRYRSTSTGLRTILTWFVTLCVSALWLLPQLVTIGNSVLDRSVAQPVPFEVGAIECRSVRSGKRCTVEVLSDIGAPEMTELRVKPIVVTRLKFVKPGLRRATLMKGDGAFGVPIVKSVTTIETEKPRR